jgi:hypothetical protein
MLAGFKKTIQVLNVCVLLNGFKIRRNDVIIIRFMNEFLIVLIINEVEK